MKRGKLIVIEGTDGSGKNTQAKLLKERLLREKIPTEMFSFPMYDTPTGRVVGQSYLGKPTNIYNWKGDTGWFPDPDKLDPMVSSLYFAGDRLFNSPEIEIALSEKEVVLLDRYAEANFGHQGGKIKDPRKREKFVRKLHNLEYNILGIPQPDAVLFQHMPLKVSVELRNRREGKTGEKADGHESNMQHLRNAEEAYLQIADLFNWIKVSCAPDGTIKSLRTPEDIHEEVYRIVMEKLKI